MGGGLSTVLSYVDFYKQQPLDSYREVRSIKAQSVLIGEKQPGHGCIHRSPSMKDFAELGDRFGFSHPSLYEWLRVSCGAYGNNKAVGFRPILNEEKTTIKDEKGNIKPWTMINLDETQYLTFTQYHDQVLRLGAGLAKLGITGQDSRVGIYEETRYEWLMSLYAMWSQNITGVTIYSNLGEDALEYAVREAEVVGLFCSGKNVKNISKLGTLPSLKYFIVYDAVPEGTQIPKGVQVVSFKDLITSEPVEALSPSKNDTALIMYTSGTTGDPKGVVMSHSNLISAVEGVSRRLERILGSVPEPEEIYLAYLPLAHILELTAENVFITRGSTICYGTPRTITDTSAKPHGDLREFKPMIFIGVPRIFDIIKKTIESKLPAVGSLKRTVFDRAVVDRKAALSKGYDTPYWNERVFSVGRNLLGGNVRAIISGGAPLNAQTHEFMTIMFGAPISQGYGLTETCAIATLQHYWDNQLENVGAPVSSAEIMLRDAGDWTSNGVPERGEIYIRGPIVTNGYFKQPEKTREVFHPDGWFASGDVGEWQPDGTLKIIGRVKALAKNAHGEYIAMEALEAVFTSNPLVVPNGICICVDSMKSYIAAIIVTDKAKVDTFLEQNNIKGTFPQVINSKEFVKKALASLEQTAKDQNRKAFEYIKQVHFCSDEWTPENGILTAAMKLKRREVEKQYAAQIKAMYEESV